MRRVRRGDIYRLKATTTEKGRPFGVVSMNELNGGQSVVGVPFYSQQLEKRRELDWCVFYSRGEGGLDKDCVAKADEVTIIDKLEIDFATGLVGTFNDEQMQELGQAMAWSLGLKL